MSHNITIEGGSSVRLLTKGKYCDRDIVVTSEGGVSWDVIQANGTRNAYQYAFIYWDTEYIKPKYKVVPTAGHCGQIFYSNKKLKKVEAEYFDFSQVPIPSYASNGDSYTFQFCSELEEIEDIGLLGYFYTGTFHGCSKLHTIAVLRSNEKTTFTSNPFHSCSSLVNINILGTIGQNGFNTQWSTKLSKASFISIINALSTTTSGLTVTFSKTAVNNAFGINIDDESTYTEEWNTLRNSKSNWTFNFV